MASDLQKLLSATSPALQIAAINANFSKIAAEDLTKIYKDQRGVPYMIMGFNSNGDTHGVKIAKPGIDVTAAGANDLIFDSDNNIFKIVDKLTLDYTSPDNTAFGTFGNDVVPLIHNLGYKPATLVFVGATFVVADEPESTDPLPFIEHAVFNAGTNAGFDWLVTQNGSLDDRLIFRVLYPPNAPPRRFKFTAYILRETAS